MDSDRRSGVSSMYSSDGRRPPGAAPPAHNARPSASDTLYDVPEQRARRDSASTFFGAGGQSPGYGQAYYDNGHEPLKSPDAKGGDWDVFADFNNTGPRYSTAFGQSAGGYQPIGTPSGKVADDVEVGRGQPAELVTVPALGPDWKADELHAMTKTGRREAKSEARKQKWNDWRRGRTKGWFSRKTLAFVIFGLCVAVGIVLAFTIPRVPSFSFNADKPLTNASSEWAEKVPTVWLRSPANFSFAAFADLRLEPGENFLPLHLTKIHARIYDGQTGRQVAEGIIKDQKFPAHKKTPLSLPLNFSYAAVNDSDQTWLNWYAACKNKVTYQDNKRPGIDFNLALDMTVFGLFGTKRDYAEMRNAACPIELPITSV